MINVCCFFLVYLAISINSYADRVQSGEAVAFYIENDSRIIGGPGSDQAYSNGFKFSYIYAENRIPVWSNHPASLFQKIDPKIESEKINYGLSLAQQIFTPMDTNKKNQILDDRPYAAWLYVGLAMSFKENDVGHFFEVDLGTVGPSALGQEAQNNFHDTIHVKQAEGWHNGLHDEPTLQLFYQKRFRTIMNKHFDFFPYYGAALGNVLLGTHIGGLIRVGIGLPNDFGPSRPSSSDGDSFIIPNAGSAVSNKSYYVFAGARGNIIARSIFLDGNSFQEGPHVSRLPMTYETEFGFGSQIHDIGLVWSFVTRSPQFSQKNKFSSFASINIIYTFN